MIKYTDSEVAIFHPVCEAALGEALYRLGLADSYRVVHHGRTGSLEMDFSIENVTTGKYLCVVEVKRTPAAVASTRNQYQAMSYVQMNGSMTERPFYALTNLECVAAFRYDPAKPRVYQQALEPGIVAVANLAEHDESALTELLAVHFAGLLDDFTHNRYSYARTLTQFAEHMEDDASNASASWKPDLAQLFYEYIRGSFLACGRDKELKDIRLFRGDLSLICEEGARVNFNDIFDIGADAYARAKPVDGTLLSEMFDLGKDNLSGDSVAEVLHQLVSAGHEHEGEVSTDYDLGRLVAHLAMAEYGAALPPDRKLCDPAAGSGSLIGAAIDVFSPGPSQVVANDVNAKLVELLSLRLGLKFARTVGRMGSPSIGARDIAELDPSCFEQVDVVVLNPPFVSGVECIERKRPLFRAIERLAGKTARTEVGQMPLEGPFLELVIRLVKPGTVVACILPRTHLVARSGEMRTMRELLVSDFGLRGIFVYPGTGLFDDVAKDTCVVVGRVGLPSSSVRVVSSCAEVANLDEADFSRSLKMPLGAGFSCVAPGLDACEVPAKSFVDSCSSGWRFLNREALEASRFLLSEIAGLEDFAKIGDSAWRLYRGNAGNSGASDLLFLSSCHSLFDRYRSCGVALRAGVKNSKHDSFVIGDGDSRFLFAPESDREALSELIYEYSELAPAKSRQRRKRKTTEELTAILDRESRKSCRHVALIPRGIRSVGRAYFVEDEAFVSTNLFICDACSREDAVILASWATTVFYQLNCEISAKNQEGMRKMEGVDIAETYAPKPGAIRLDDLPGLDETLVEAEGFIDLHLPKAREVDRIWARALFGDRAECVLDEACRHLAYLVAQRNP